MIYLSAEYILSAIQQLASTHTFIGITFLTCKKNQLPIGNPIEFMMDRQTKQFMTSVHKICPSSDFYFQPYQTIRGKQWLAAKYPSSGLQAINTQTFGSAFIHDRNSKMWAWSEDYVSQIKKIAVTKDEKKASLPAMAVWVLKDRKWKDTATLEDVVSKFISEYHLTQDPKWQRTILPALVEVQKHLATELEVQFIIATHSPLIMASSESIFDVNIDKLFQIMLSAENADATLSEESYIKYGQVIC